MHFLGIKRLKSEKGAVAVIVATLFTTGFIFGMFALVVDVGAIQLEKRTLQNAGDAAVTGAAYSCAMTNTNCSSALNLTNVASTYLNGNSKDGISFPSLMCGYTPLSPCTTQTSCKAIPSTYPLHVRLVSSTQNPDKSMVIKPIFAGIYSTNLKNGYSVSTCSQAAWGRASFARVQPISIPICFYNVQETPIAIPAFDINATNINSCNVVDLDGRSFTFSSIANGFSFINFNDGKTTRLLDSDCTTTNPVNESTTTSGNILSNAENLNKVCINSANTLLQLQNWVTNGKTYFLPAIGSVAAQGGNSINYPVLAFYKFKLLGFSLNGGKDTSSPKIPQGTINSSCGKKDCIYGIFTKGTVPSARVSTNTNVPSVGARAVEILP